MGFQDTFNTQVIPAGDRAFGISITISRGGVASSSLTAVWESIDYQVFTDDGFPDKFASRDWMFDKDDAVISAATIQPQAGDRIAVTENGTAKTFEIVAIGSMPACEEMDGGFRWRVHSKQVA